MTPNVAGEASQFFDPATGTGPPTQESGRVTALAIDPNCGKASAPPGAPCRLWVASAGGGIWRTNDALAAQPRWIAPPASLPTNAFGSLIVDATAGSGLPTATVYGLTLSQSGNVLYAATHGRGAWKLTLP